ncbi:MAG: phosphoribosyltransferase [Bdellovibrio bacteriovorus]
MVEKLRCELVSNEAVYDLAWTLAERVRASGFRPDLVVAISRGGFTPARVLCDVLGLFNLTSIRVVHYRGPADKEPQATVKYPLCIPVEGQRLLVVDDVNDTGDTLQAARAHLDSLGPAEVRTAVLHEKVGSPVRADYAAGTIDEWRWLIYPWAVVEDVGGFLGRMEPPPGDAAAARERLRLDYGLEVPDALVRRLLALVAGEARA